MSETLRQIMVVDAEAGGNKRSLVSDGVFEEVRRASPPHVFQGWHNGGRLPIQFFEARQQSPQLHRQFRSICFYRVAKPIPDLIADRAAMFAVEIYFDEVSGRHTPVIRLGSSPKPESGWLNSCSGENLVKNRSGTSRKALAPRIRLAKGDLQRRSGSLRGGSSGTNPDDQ
jgi:hypothetical protein